MIPQSFIQELLGRVDIVDVIERYVPLKKAGANYAACCPFHNEKSPSFTVSPSKQFYHCFGCGAHGTAIGFLMEYQAIGFVEAVEELAKTFGLAVPRESRNDGAGGRTEPGTASLFSVMQQALRYYRSALKNSEKAVTYLKQRGLTGEIAARFGIGYAPDGWQSLEAVFSDYSKSALLIEAGLVIENENGRRYDRFRDRIMFPILDSRGNVIGFGGRVIGSGEPKYLNSPETPLFQKGHELYGLVQARKAVRQAGCILVVEGYMDVVALAQHGVEYAVATLGTATTPYHVQRLLRLADRIIYCFDGDEAGRRAAWRALENSLPALTDNAELSFLFLPEGEDPDSYIRQHGQAGFEGLMERAVPLSQFLFKELTGRIDIQTEEGRSRLVQSAKPLIEKVAAPTLSLLLKKRLAELSGLTPTQVDTLVPKVQPAGDGRAKARAPRKAPSLGRRLLQMLVVRPDLGRRVEWEPTADDSVELRTFASVLAFLAVSPHIANGAALLEAFRGRPEESLLMDISAEVVDWDEGLDLAQEFEGALAQLTEAARQKRIAKLLALDRTQGLTAEQKRLLVQELAGSRAS
jgi:DNA primase